MREEMNTRSIAGRSTLLRGKTTVLKACTKTVKPQGGASGASEQLMLQTLKWLCGWGGAAEGKGC